VKYFTHIFEFLNKDLELDYICDEVLRYFFGTIFLTKLEIPTVQTLNLYQNYAEIYLNHIK
jgi:hypothetical protein